MRAIRRRARTVAVVLILFAVPGVAGAALGLWDSTRDRPAVPVPQVRYDFDQQAWVEVDPNVTDEPGHYLDNLVDRHRRTTSAP